MRTAAELVEQLRERATEAELVKLTRRLPEGEPAFGVRMGELFAIAKAGTPTGAPPIRWPCRSSPGR